MLNPIDLISISNLPQQFVRHHGDLELRGKAEGDPLDQGILDSLRSGLQAHSGDRRSGDHGHNANHRKKQSQIRIIPAEKQTQTTNKTNRRTYPPRPQLRPATPAERRGEGQPKYGTRPNHSEKATVETEGEREESQTHSFSLSILPPHPAPLLHAAAVAFSSPSLTAASPPPPSAPLPPLPHLSRAAASRGSRVGVQWQGKRDRRWRNRGDGVACSCRRATPSFLCSAPPLPPPCRILCAAVPPHHLHFCPVPRCSRLLVFLFYMELHIGFGIVAGSDFIHRLLLSSSIGSPANSDLVGRSLGYPGRQPSAEIEGASPASVLVSWWFATSQQRGGASVLCSLDYLLATSPSPAHLQVQRVAHLDMSMCAILSGLKTR